MTTPGAQTIGDELFDRASKLMAQEDVSEWELASLDREAKKLAGIDVGEGYIVRSAVAALRWDIENAKRFGDEAVARDPSFETYVNAAVTMGYVNRADFAAGYVDRAAERFGLSPVLAEKAIAAHLALADVRAAAAIHERIPGTWGDELVRFDVDAISEALDTLQIGAGRLQEELGIAFDVLTENKRRYCALGAGVARDLYDDPETVIFTLYYLGANDGEDDLQARLASRQLDLPEWDPRVLSVNLRAITSSNAH